jgi:glycerol-3-phosphate dehydrogenase
MPHNGLMTTGRLDPAERARALDRLEHGEVDVLVVGGGVVGAGAALDAVSRGLTVGLLERRDWAAGTSSRSSRLAHGGLRYLEQFEFGLVHEALTERGLLLETLAPHLVRPVPFVLPLTKGWERPYVGAGVALYDVLSRVSRKGGTLPGHRHLTRKAALRLAPALRPDSLTGAIGYFDAQIDDARHTLALVRTAAAHGAYAANGVEVTGFLRDGDRVVGVEARDVTAGRALEIRARRVIGATGVWTEDTRALLGGADADALPVRPSKGVHLIVARDRIDSRTAVITRTPTSVLFLLPWGEQWLVGTTDTPYDGDRDEPEATEADVAYLLDQANRWLVDPLTRDDVIAVYAGLRPLLAGTSAQQPADDETARLSREHAVRQPAPGFVTIAGGKYTTYRVMAADVVDAAVEGLAGDVPASRTESLRLVGADGFAELMGQCAFLGAEHGLTEAEVRRLLHRYGGTIDEVLAPVAADPGLGARLHPESPVLRCEIVYAATHEGALGLEDVLSRRTRLALQARDGGRSVAAEVAALVGPVLGWDADRQAREAAAYIVSPIGQVAPGAEGPPAAANLPASTAIEAS